MIVIIITVGTKGKVSTCLIKQHTIKELVGV